MPVTLEQMGVTEQYIEDYPYSDEAMYLRFLKEPRGVDRHRDYFIKWFENGKKPLLTMARYRLNDIVVQLKQIGVQEEEFLNIDTCVSPATMHRLWVGGSSMSHQTAEKVIKQVLEIFGHMVTHNED